MNNCGSKGTNDNKFLFLIITFMTLKLKPEDKWELKVLFHDVTDSKHFRDFILEKYMIYIPCSLLLYRQRQVGRNILTKVKLNLAEYCVSWFLYILGLAYLEWVVLSHTRAWKTKSWKLYHLPQSNKISTLRPKV